LEGIWKLVEPASEGLSLLKLAAREDLGELSSPASERA
jgi:hypothetical protein